MPEFDSTIEYREIPGCPPWYMVGSDGSFWSRRISGWSDKFGEWRLLPGGTDSHGYRRYHIEGKYRYFHQLMAAIFIGPRPSGLMVRHLDGDNLNNRIENLAYGTQKDNMEDAVRHGTSNRGERHGMTDLTNEQVRMIGNWIRAGYSMQSIAQRTGVPYRTIYNIKIGDCWGWLFSASELVSMKENKSSRWHKLKQLEESLCAGFVA
jgi:predicted DNA-binding protein YlxM (UPF0122 family)